MDFDFSDDQVQLRDAVRRWVDKGYTFDRRKAIVAAGGFDRTAYTELAELGLCGLYVADDHGGLGMGPVEGMVVMEELGRGIVLEPLAQTLVASGVLGGYAGAELQSSWLPRVAGPCGWPSSTRRRRWLARSAGRSSTFTLNVPLLARRAPSSAGRPSRRNVL